MENSLTGFMGVRRWALAAASALAAIVVSFLFAASAGAYVPPPSGPPQPAAPPAAPTTPYGTPCPVPLPGADGQPFGDAGNAADPLQDRAFGGDPLDLAAHLFVDGPLHGFAAGAISDLLDINSSQYPDNYGWDEFWNAIQGPGYLGKASPEVRADVADLALIANEQEPQRLSLYSGGGGGAALYGQTQKILCHNLTADESKSQDNPTPTQPIPVIETFFIFPNGQYCPSVDEERNWWPTFKDDVDGMATGTADFPVVYLVELDSMGTAGCLSGAPTTWNVKSGQSGGTKIVRKKGHKQSPYCRTHPNAPKCAVIKVIKIKLPASTSTKAVKPSLVPTDSGCGGLSTGYTIWECELGYEANALASRPHTLVYVEGGYSDGPTAQQVTQRLLDMDAVSIHQQHTNFRGIFTNDTHNNWISSEFSQNEKIAANPQLTWLHYVVNSAQSGSGLLKPASAVASGNEVTCNPKAGPPGSGVAMGRRYTAGQFAGAPHADATLWTFVPGRSSGPCSNQNPTYSVLGGPPPGDFWPARAVQLAAFGSDRLGPSDQVSQRYGTGQFYLAPFG